VRQAISNRITIMSSSLRLTASSSPGAAGALLQRRPLHVVMVDEELPYPANSGKRIRTLNLTLRLARRHRVTYVCHRNADAEEARAAAAFLSANAIAPVVVERTVPPKSGPGFYLRLAANLLSPLPYSVATHRSQAIQRALADLACTPVDLWHCEWTPYAESLRGLPGKRVIVAHNVESLIWQRYAETESSRLRRWYIRRQWRKFLRFERRTLAAAERTVAVSELDAARLRDDFGVERIDVVENGVDTGYFRPRDISRDPARVLFLGSLDWRPNLDGVRLLLEEVFPAVRAQLPEATLALVGRNPPAWLWQRACETSGVELHATVPDVRPFLASCGLMVVPLRVGGGSRLKILEALATETPVVSTRIGAEGLALHSGRHLSVVEDISDLSEAIIAAIRDPATAREQAVRGREVILQRYDWDVLADRMEQVWLECASQRMLGGASR
jgi:glycosyltransferase involved in cell wall biosynthesis